MDDLTEQNFPPITSLSAKQRRIIGVLVEKGFTTPAYYPLTLKAVVTGCNQSSNRDPVVNYSEDAAEEALNELRELGLAAVVHTESGRSERYRHYMRKRFDFTEPQLAILVELLLRGRQSLGNLRARASRMVPIDTLEELRDELAGLMEKHLVQADGPLERRGVEVDHNLYPATEKRASMAPSAAPAEAAIARQAAAVPAPAADTSEFGRRVDELAESVTTLKLENAELRRELAELRDQLDETRGEMSRLRHELGDG